MSMPSDTIAAYDAEHERAALNLPWYVNGTLNEAEQADVRAHLAQCLVCRRELAALQVLSSAVAARTREPRTEAALARIHERCDDRSAQRRLFPWTAAAVLVIVAGLAGFVGINTGLLGSGSGHHGYLTLGARSINAPDVALVTARIVFGHGVTERQLRELLLDAQAELIDGPTPRGAYTIALPRVSRDDDLQQAVAALRASERVLFVEPVVSVRQRPRAD
ncbi:MAG: anti-sigma factor family protein [Gammaproteobacteria bacterium]